MHVLSTHPAATQAVWPIYMNMKVYTLLHLLSAVQWLRLAGGAAHFALLFSGMFSAPINSVCNLWQWLMLEGGAAHFAVL